MSRNIESRYLHKCLKHLLDLWLVRVRNQALSILEEKQQLLVTPALYCEHQIRMFYNCEKYKSNMHRLRGEYVQYALMSIVNGNLATVYALFGLIAHLGLVLEIGTGF